MKKLILLGTLLAALLSIFAISALMVSAAPTPPSVRDMLARPTPRTNVADVSASVPANILRGISYTGTGQIITEAPCSINRRDVYAYPSTIPNNGTYAFELPLERSFDIIGLGTLPGLCTLQEVAPELFFVSSPDGEVLEPRVHRFLPQTGLRSNAATFYQLPIEALAQPGTWQIGISRGFVMNVEIPQAQRPFYAQLDQKYVIGGFQPMARVTGVIFSDQFDFSVAYSGEFEVLTNEFGYAALFVPEEHDSIFFVSEYGETIIGNTPANLPGWDIQNDALANTLRNAYWPNWQSALASLTTPTPVPTNTSVAPSGPPAIRLDYASDWLALTNVSGANLDMTGLNFSGSAGSMSILEWDTAFLGKPLDAFRSNDCLQVFNFSIEQPGAPAGCNFVQGWIATGDTNMMFWRGDFIVSNNGVQVASCRAADGSCAFPLN